jgi:hypothetical protein
MPKKPSFDTAKIKDFMFQKGERVGLGVVGGISLLLLVLAFVGITTKPADSANSATWQEAFTKKEKTIRNQLATSQPEVKKVVFADKVPDAIKEAKNFALLYPYHVDKNDKKRNPPILSIIGNQANNEERSIQLDYVAAPALKYGVNFDSGRIDVSSERQLIRYLQPKRMVVVTAAFPYQEQLKLYVAALQYNSIEDLLKNKPALPHFLGLNIWRTEVVPGVKEEDLKWVQLYFYDQDKQKTVVHKGLDQFFRSMVIDGYNPSQLGGYLGPNLATPLPLLASVASEAGKYPKLNLTGFEQPESTEDDGKSKITRPVPTMQQPAAGGKDAGKGTIAAIPVFWAQIGDKDLIERLNGKYNLFDPFGRSEGKASPDKTLTNIGVAPKIGNQNIPNQNVPKKDEKEGPSVPLGVAVEDTTGQLAKILVRFIDIDLEVGKTYRYAVQVRMANPNYGNIKEVVQQQLAGISELDSMLAVRTPDVSVPGEIHYYAFDPLQAKLKMHSTYTRGGVDMKPLPGVSDVNAPVQIHRWITRFTEPGGNEHVIGDWAIAERLLVKRGDPLGRDVLVEVPQWDWKHGRFSLGETAKNPKQKPLPHIPVNFLVEDVPAPLLVDFQGGEHDKYRAQKSASGIGIRDSAAVELLVLDENGNLLLRNAHDDATDPLRLEHEKRWQRRLEAVRAQSGSSAAPSKSGPGIGGAPGIR